MAFIVIYVRPKSSIVLVSRLLRRDRCRYISGYLDQLIKAHDYIIWHIYEARKIYKSL